MMRNMQLTAHWTPSDVHNILAFLSDLQAVIQANYADQLEQFYQEIGTEESQEDFDFEDDMIPF